MADFFRVQLGVVSRSDGHSAAKRAAYQSCGRIVDHEGRTFDFSRKATEHVATMVLAPENAPDWSRNPELLWQRAAAAEKRFDAQEARIVDFSMPRQIPEALWETCIRHAYQPFIKRGMVLQIDIHDTAASDGGRNVNVHGLASLRQIEDSGFSKKKDRTWNDLFRERSGRTIREMFAERLTSFCQQHSIPYEGDARPNAERDLPAPEPQLPKWNFEAFARTAEMPEALTALYEHRRVRREWEAARADEIEATLELGRMETRVRLQRQRRVAPTYEEQIPSSKADRRAAILRTWHKNGWIDAETIPAITAIRFDQRRDILWIDLADGSTLIDRGDAITLRGSVTWTAALETAAAAERHRWKVVEVHGEQGYKDAVTMACLLRGIEVTNHRLSAKAQAKFYELLGGRDKCSTTTSEHEVRQTEPLSSGQLPVPSAQLATRSSQQIHHDIMKRKSAPVAFSEDASDTESAAPTFSPNFRKPRAKM